MFDRAVSRPALPQRPVPYRSERWFVSQPVNQQLWKDARPYARLALMFPRRCQRMVSTSRLRPTLPRLRPGSGSTG